MRFLYVKNYLKITRNEKISFLKFINILDGIELKNQKILLSDSSLLLELSEESDIDLALRAIEKFFKNDEDIEAIALKRILMEEKYLTLVFSDEQTKKVML